MTGQIITTQGQTIMFNRTFKSTPDYSVPSLFKVGTGTTDPTISDTDVETGVDITAGVEEKAFLTGYPVLDETNLQVTIRCFLNTLEANGNSLSEFAVFNDDSTKKIFSRSTFVPITKTSSIQISFVEKDKL